MNISMELQFDPDALCLAPEQIVLQISSGNQWRWAALVGGEGNWSNGTCYINMPWTNSIFEGPMLAILASGYDQGLLLN